MAKTKVTVIKANKDDEMEFNELQIGDWFIFQDIGTLCVKVGNNSCMDFDENDFYAPSPDEKVTLIKEIEIKYKV